LFAQTEDMILIVALTAIGILAGLTAVTALLRHVVGRDGYGHRPPPRSHPHETTTYALLPG
jgi:hypothetical protein